MHHANRILMMDDNMVRVPNEENRIHAVISNERKCFKLMYLATAHMPTSNIGNLRITVT